MPLPRWCAAASGTLAPEATRVRTLLGPLLLKYLVIGVLSALILPAVGGLHWSLALLPALAVTLATYAVDHLALPSMGNAGTVVLDFAVALGLFWAVPWYLPGGVRLGFGGALTAAGAVATAEIVYHQYLLRQLVK